MAGNAGRSNAGYLDHITGMVAVKPGISLFIVARGAVDTGRMVLMGICFDIGMAVNAV